MGIQKKVWANPEVTTFGSVEMHTGGRGRHKGRHDWEIKDPRDDEHSDCVRPVQHVYRGHKKHF